MAIAKTTVTHKLIDPSASPVQRGGVIVLGGFTGGQWRDIQGMTADGQIVTLEPADADDTGSWSVDLIPNNAVASPLNTLYRYMPVQGAPVVFEVGAGGPFDLADLVVTDPAQWPGLTPTTVGPAGPPNVLHEGTIATGEPGTDAEFTITGEAPDQTLNLTIPRGDKGEAATVDVDPAPETGEPGTDVSVENTGDTHAAVFKFTIPRGNQGAGLEFVWNGTKLGVRIQGDTDYSYTDLIGPIGPQGVVWKGSWSSATAYAVGDAVAYNGSSYLCIAIRSATATTPDADAAHWALMAQRGTDGSGSVASVNGQSPDGGGNVALGWTDVPGTIPTSKIPAAALTIPMVVADEAAMLALDAQQGDVAIRSDNQIAYMLAADGDPTVLSDWLAISTPGGVTSVNGQQGVVVLAAADVGALPDSTEIPSTAADVGAVALADGIVAVDHDDDPDVARPEGVKRVIWFGTVEPTNALARDMWADTTEES